MKNTKVHVYITPEIHAHLKQLAEREDRSVSYLVTRAVKVVYGKDVKEGSHVKKAK